MAILTSTQPLWRWEDRSAVDAARAQVDADIDKTKRFLIQLKIQRNALSSIARLPEDLLTRVFLECSRAPEFPSIPNKVWRDIDVDEYYQRLYPITHTCSHWRRVAQYYAPLWSFVDFTIPERVEQIFDRFPFALFFFRVDLAERSLGSDSDGNDHSSNFFPGDEEDKVDETSDPQFDRPAFAFANLSRVRSLVLCDAPAATPVVFRKVLEQAYPSLKKLIWSAVSDSSYTLPSTLFGGLSSCLLSASLRGCLDWQSVSFLTSVKELEVAGRTPSSTLAHMLHALQSFHSLEKLDLKNAIPEHEQYVPMLPSTTLHRLSELSVEDMGSLCSSFLNHIACPCLVTVALVPFSPLPMTQLSTFLKSLWSNCKNTGIKPPTTICIKTEGICGGPCMQLWSPSSYVHHTDSKPVFELVVDIGLSSMATAILTEWRAVLSTLEEPPSTLRLVQDLTWALTWDHFEPFSAHIRNMEIRNAEAQRALLELQVFPALQKMFLSGISVQSAEDLISWLERNRDQGINLPEVHMYGCSDVDPSVISRLERLTGKSVIWDGSGARESE